MTNWINILAENSTSTWLFSGILFATIVCAALVTRFVAVKYLSAYAARTQTKIDDVLLLVLKKANIFIIMVIAAFFAQTVIVIPEKLTQLLKIAAISGAFLQLALWGNAVISFFLADATRRAGDQDINISARRAMAYLGRLILWLLILALLLENLGVRLTPLLAGIGIGGVAVALAIQNILGDIFCYIAIILDKPFIAGDFLVIDNLMGTVERIGIKNTRIRSLSGELLIFANHDLVNSRVRNYKTLRERRVVMTFGVTYETPMEKLRSIPHIVRGIFSSVKATRLDRVHFSQFGDFSLMYEVVYFVLTGDYTTFMDAQQDVNLSLKEQFGKEGIDFAYPTQTLYIPKTQGGCTGSETSHDRQRH